LKVKGGGWGGEGCGARISAVKGDAKQAIEGEGESSRKLRERTRQGRHHQGGEWERAHKSGTLNRRNPEKVPGKAAEPPDRAPKGQKEKLRKMQKSIRFTDLKDGTMAFSSLERGEANKKTKGG